MSDEQTTKQTTSTQSSAEAWREVGDQFKVLGNTLAEAFRSTWQDEENRKRVQELQAGLETMVKQVGTALNETAKSPQAQQARAEAGKAAESLRAAGEQTVQEIRPHLLNALRQLNEELSKLVKRSETEGKSGDNKTVPPAGNGSH